MENKDKQLPESPISVTYSIQTKKGFNVLFTLRDGVSESKIKSFVDAMSYTEGQFEIAEIKPQPQKIFGGSKPPVKVVGKCPKDGGNLIEKTSKAGKVYWACENGKYDYATKTRSGCDYVNFDPTGAEAEAKKTGWNADDIPVGDYNG